MVAKIIVLELGVFVLLLVFIFQRLSFIIKIQKKMDQALATYEAFLNSISGSLTSISNSVATLAAGINPSGLTAADAAQLKTDLGNLATAATAAATAAETAASNAAAGNPAPAAPTPAS